MFKLTSTSGQARTGELKTAHGIISTPFFMPVATKGAIKFLDFEDLKKTGTQCIISNSWLLSERPGLELIKEAGGLHKFCNWDRGIFTDSGGFQTLDGFFKQKSTEEGILMKSPFDGKSYVLTPEMAMDIQMTLAPDVAMCLDDVPRHDDDQKTILEKTERTHRWALRCKTHHNKKGQLLFGIAQGGNDPKLRKKSIEYISSLGFDGIALGGLAIGEPISTMHDMIEKSINFAPKEKPRYLMGVGSPEDILLCILMGVDCFDSTFPTQNGRHGTIFTWKGRLKITNKKYRNDLEPIDRKCKCIACKNYSRAYIHHQLRVGEAVGKRLATFHNIFFVQELVKWAAMQIRKDTTNNLNQLIQDWSNAAD